MLNRNHRIIADITDFIFVEDVPQEADIIFIPGGSHPALPELAAQLYARRYAPFILPAGKFSVKTGRFAGVKDEREVYFADYETECAFFTDVLLQNGVPPEAIIPEAQSTTTQENALFSKAVLEEKSIKITNAILCAKSFHARRCLMLYQMAFPDVSFSVAPVDVGGITRDNWHCTEAGVERVLGELARCGNQFPQEIKTYLGLA